MLNVVIIKTHEEKTLIVVHTYKQIPRICTVEIIGLSNSAYTIIIVEIMHKPQDEINENNSLNTMDIFNEQIISHSNISMIFKIWQFH